MCKVSKWVLSLGIMAVTPGVALSGPLLPFSFSKAKKAAASSADSQSVAKSGNQQMAENIAAALRDAKLAGYNVEIEFRDGVAILKGQVLDVGQKAKATSVASRIPGVTRVDNRLIAIGQLANGGTIDIQSPVIPASYAEHRADASGAIQPTAGEQDVSETAEGPIPAAEVSSEAEAPRSNQKMAEEIAAALSSAKLNGYDIEIRYQHGIAVLTGSVANRNQWQQAGRVVSSVPGVQSVQNRMTVRGEDPYGSSAPITRTALQPVPGQPPMPPQGPPAAGPAGPMGPGEAGMPAPPNYGHPGQGASYTVYNMPNVPEYAWPSYASYPNYAQVAYPKQYSASAWPYIGPFYPYPQIPLGWRQAQLEWDDGYWNLNFNPRTDKWWWFLHPKNW